MTIYDNGVAINNAIVSSSGTFNTSVYLTTEGLNSLTAAVTDSYGNLGGTTAATTVDLDNIAPTVTITSTPVSGVLSSAVFAGQVLSGGDASVDLTKVVVLDNNVAIATISTNASGAFTYTDTTLVAGANSFTAVAYDSFGNKVTSAAQVDMQNATATTITETQGNQSITPTGQTIINLFGINNAVTSSYGGLTIKGDSGSSTISIAGANNTLVLGGANEHVLITADGPNSITVAQGGATITTGNGNEVVTAYGYQNSITVGNGDSTITALAGSTAVLVGTSNSTGTITLGGTQNVVTTGGGNWTVTAGNGNSTIYVGAANDAIKLNGAGDVINIGSGGATVTGVGYDTTYAMSDINGGLTVANFTVANNDVLDLTGLEHNLGVTPYYIAAAQDQANHSALDIFVVTGTVGAYSVHEVASLNGVGSSSLASLEAHQTILV